MEIWKDVKGFEGRYQVSNTGNVKSLRFLGHDGERLMKLSLHHSGYIVVQLGKHPAKTYLVHDLVAQAFVPQIYGKNIVNHIDGNKRNNCADNLEWVTYKENTEHAIRTGLRNPHNIPRRYGKDNHSSKAVLQYDLDGNFIKKWDSQSDIARAFNVRPSTISACVDKANHTFNGFVWISDTGNIAKRIKPHHNRLSKLKVDQFDLNGCFIESWDDAMSAAEALRIPYKGIRECCYGRQKTSGGYIWKLR